MTPAATQYFVNFCTIFDIPCTYGTGLQVNNATLESLFETNLTKNLIQRYY